MSPLIYRRIVEAAAKNKTGVITVERMSALGSANPRAHAWYIRKVGYDFESWGTKKYRLFR